MSGIQNAEFAEGDQAGKRGNVDPHQQSGVIGGKAGKQDGRRYVADGLAGQNGYQQSIFLQQGRKELIDDLHTGQIACKNKEKEKGAKQGIVHRP